MMFSYKTELYFPCDPCARILNRNRNLTWPQNTSVDEAHILHESED